MFNTYFVLALSCSLVGFSFGNPTANDKYIDGTQYTIKNLGTTYTQRISDSGRYFCLLDRVVIKLEIGIISKD